MIWLGIGLVCFIVATVMGIVLLDHLDSRGRYIPKKPIFKKPNKSGKFFKETNNQKHKE